MAVTVSSHEGGSCARAFLLSSELSSVLVSIALWQTATSLWHHTPHIYCLPVLGPEVPAAGVGRVVF